MQPRLIQIALMDKLGLDTQLVAWLSSGVNSMYVEGDPPPTAATPFLLFQFVNERPLPNTKAGFRESWIIRAYDRQAGYYDIEENLERVYNDLNDQTLILPPEASVYVFGDGIQYMGYTTKGYDQLFKAQHKGIMIDVHLHRK